MQYEEEDLPPHINDPYVEDMDDGHEVEPRETLTSIMPRVAGRVDVDKILTDISEGRVTRKHLTNFCAHFSFVSSIEPLKVQDALMDNDWLVDTSPSYLLFQTLLPLFWTLTCMI